MDFIGQIVIVTYVFTFLLIALSFLVVFYLFSVYFRNRETINSGLNKFAIVPSFCIFVFMTFYNLGFFSPKNRNYTPPLSYNISPFYYNIVSEIILPIVLSFLAFFIILRKTKFQHSLIITIILLIFVLPYRPINDLLTYSDVQTSLQNNPYYASQSVSKKEMDDLEKSIVSNIIGEEIIYDQKQQTKVLRIKTSINVPKEGHYRVSDYQKSSQYPRILTSTRKVYYKAGEKFKDFGIESNGYLRVTANDVNIYSLEEDLYLKAGINSVNFDFPVIIAAKVGENWESRINLCFVDGIDGIYGPYAFGFSIYSYKTDKGLIMFNYSSPLYLTKTYSYEDLKSDVPKWTN